MNGLVLDFFKISPRNTSLETLKVDTEFGYRVTPIAKYPLTRIPISNGGLVVSTQQARILQVRNLSRHHKKIKGIRTTNLRLGRQDATKSQAKN